ncbi:restriction endonuclease subunit S [Flavobacterium sp. ZB4R12]|uniref:restriction endonuclease subunit S n=1 Tax=Flavobacterium sp. ZB4R12 TaxID=3398732 RepID=UPI003AAD6239
MRFPEFTGEWEVKKLGEIAEFKAGYAFKSEDMLSEKSNYQLLKMSNVYQSELRLDRNPSYWEKINDKEKEFLLKKGDSILTLTGTVGKRDFGYSVMIKDDNKYLLNQRLVLLREKKGKSINGFINQILSNERFLFYFFGEAKGGTGNQTNLGTEDVKNIQLNFPSISEQQKIAYFLSLIDDRIQTQSKIIGELKVIKSTVSKKIFSQQLRFENDWKNNFSDWEIKKMSDVCEIVMGQSPSSISYNTEEIGVPLIQGNADILNRITSPRNWTTEMTKECIVGDLILTVRAPVGAVAKSVHNACIGRGVCVIRSNSDNSIEFMYQFLLDYEDKWNKLEQGSTFTAVSGNEIKKLEISIPSVEEQIKIANFLFFIDEKIETERMLLKQFENQKKYLLSNLFI